MPCSMSSASPDPASITRVEYFRPRKRVWLPRRSTQIVRKRRSSESHEVGASALHHRAPPCGTPVHHGDPASLGTGRSKCQPTCRRRPGERDLGVESGWYHRNAVFHMVKQMAIAERLPAHDSAHAAAQDSRPTNRVRPAAGPLNRPQVVDRVVDILEAFLWLGPQLGVSELSRALGLKKATTHRLLGSLRRRDFVTQD